MQASNTIKIVAAFAAGLVVALASALFYVRLHDRQLPEPTATVAAPALPNPVAPDPGPSTAPTPSTAAPAKAEASAARQEPEVEPAPVARPKRTVPRKTVTPISPALREPVQVVQNTVPAAPSPGNPTAYPATSAAAPMEQTSQPAGSMQDAAPPPPPPAPQPNVVELAAGTNLAIRLGETLSTDHNYSGDTFRGTLLEPIIRDGFIIADKGSKVLGQIVTAQPAGRVQGVAELKVTLTQINTTDGQQIRVETNSVDKQGQKSTGSDAAKIAGGAALGAIIGALGGGGKGAAIGAGAGGAAGTGVVLATRGKAAVLPSESRLTFTLAAPVRITEKLNN